jgi:hypothetical protein
MATQAKAAPAANKKTAPKKGYSAIKKTPTAPSQKVYEIIKGGGIIFKLRTEATVFDVESNTVRTIRYCPGESSIYKEEQSPSARRSHIAFNNGLLAVNVSQPNLMEFVDKHPSNVDNGGNKFKLVDNSTDS